MLAKSLTALPIVLFAAMFLRLAGVGITWLPSAVSLATFGLAALAFKALAIHRVQVVAAASDWRGLLDRYGFGVGLAGLALLAVLIRLPSIGADLGHQPIDIDEHRLASNVKQFFVTGELGHRTVEHYPGAFFWAVTGASLLMYLHGLMEGAFHTIRNMPLEAFVLAGRLVNTLIAAATVVVAGLIGRQMSSGAAGLVAAGLIAIAPLSVQTTTALRNDAAQVLLTCAAVHAALAASSTDRRLWLVLAGAFGGAATAIKYTSVFTLLPALVASLMRGSATARAVRAAIVVVAFLLTVATTNHFLWWDFPNFVMQLSDQVGITGPGHWAASANPQAFHTDILARFGVGWVLLILAAAFGVHGLATGRPHAWVFWLCPLIYSWFTTKRPSQFPRWVFPLLPFVAVAGASALVATAAAVRKWPAWANRPSGAKLRQAALAMVGVAALGQPLWMGAVTTSQRLKPSTHDVVEQWLHQRTSGERVLVPNGWLDLSNDQVTVRRVADLDAVLQGSPYALAANDWVVVPETFRKNPGLKRLMLVTRVNADSPMFGGKQGYDYEIYAPPKLPPSTGPIEIRPDAAGVDPFLGLEWEGPARGEPGWPLPARGASLYLPPRVKQTATITVDVTGDTPVGVATGLSITDSAGPVALLDVPASEPSRRSLQGVARLAPGGRATELRLAPASRGRRVRVLRVLVE